MLVAIFAPLIAPHDPYLNDMSQTLQTAERGALAGDRQPGPRHVQPPRVRGAGPPCIVGFGTVAVAAIVGMILGLLAGYLGGVVNGVIMRIMDALMGFPMLVLALLLAAVLGGGMQNVIIALAVATLPGYTRLMCGETLSVKENEYIMAQRAIGAKSLRTMVRHVLPNAFQPILVLITTMLGNVILAEAASASSASASSRPGAAWGSMAADGYRYPRSLTRCSRSLPPSPSCWWCSPSTWWATVCATPSTRGCGASCETLTANPHATRAGGANCCR